ncbi:uncharacterized protein N7483_013185 [Penicillium malachiteum]|uniref:uncharacterized protein n=1 Tax=Penicillium malachiteum TaxID=1324776 RepID=UPI002547A802|nr:uncharacterized protein N7483_013185 [Penicillium malachiteum]KAJ5716004.1 hypothetical protein N7483_013185 [Penicillium malachiteum]
MFRPAARALARSPAVAARTPATTRLISTGPTPKSRSLKSSVLRLGLAGGAIYYYNTSSAFSEEPSFSVLSHLRKDNASDASSQTLDSITPKIREERAAAKALEGGLNAQQLEEEAGQQAAFNPETGEINWDCPCLGGMAHGPCGEEFKAAFSCFVYSEEEPKGMECIDKFKGMQDCFRQHPEIYGAELEDDDEPETGAPASSEQPPAATEQQDLPVLEEQPVLAQEDNTDVAAISVAAEADILLPKAAHDVEEKTQ